LIKTKIKNILVNPHKKELLKGSVESIVIKVAGMMIGYTFIVILSRNYGAEAVGIYQIALQFMAIMVTISLFGFNQSIIRFTAELASKNHINELISLQRRFSVISFSIASILAIGVFIYSKELAITFLKDENLAIVFQSLSFMLPFFTLNNLFVETLRGLKKIKISEFFRLFSIRFFNLVGFLIAIWLVKFNNLLPIFTFEIAMFLSFILVFYFSQKYLKEKLVDNEDEKERTKRDYISTSFTMYQSILLMMMSNQVLVFILAYYTDPAEVGVYNVAFQIANLVIFISGALSTVLMPKFSEVYHNDRDNFKNIVRFSSKLFFWSTGVLSIISIVYADSLMAIFGSEFVAGSIFLIILSIGNFLNAITGIGGGILDMVGKQHIRRNLLLFNTTVAIVLGTYLIRQYGALGLAYTVLVRMSISSILSVYFMKKLFDINLIYIPMITKG